MRAFVQTFDKIPRIEEGANHVIVQSISFAIFFFKEITVVGKVGGKTASSSP